MTAAAYYTGQVTGALIVFGFLIGLFALAWLDGLTAGPGRPPRARRPHTSARVGRPSRVVGHTSKPRDHRSSMARPRSRSHGGEHRRRPEPRNAR